ncbi:45 kDa calcium-binding protein isoform X2 [Haemorhous mexicanus]|uniref:45 kDa calcium-binding protein isoform X2 n=1 Tax=Haemorhous mexicanus TaxID=30427 RepID=UPI0028BDAC55|nr:45 kDa calcium-binding protein isoform X2 [Haemorhous mexicanus]
MMSRQAFLCSLGSLYLSLLFIFLLMDVYARPANHSVLKERAGEAREENEILPPDHLNGVKMELDGHLNKEFHQEVFLGKEREEFEEDSQPRRNRRKLVGIFSKVDINNDKKISAKEMQRWIMEKTDEHFQEAVEENKMHFRAVDPDGDGHVSWDEYKIKFLASKGFNEKEIAEKIKNNEELKIDEENQDGDKKLTLSEFISLPVGTVENQQAQDIDDDWVRDRRKEFQEVIDANHDGIVTMEELEEYMDPMNEHNALNEARQMIAVADENQNHHLELEEILKYSEYFTGSKLMDYARNVHEEF